MVSKVAVIALVAIVAVPILLGYAFALDEYTETRYSDDNKYTNVTPLLLNSSTYDLSEANMYSLNSDVFHVGGSGGPGFYPEYESYGSAVSPIVRQSAYTEHNANNYSMDMANAYYVQGFITGPYYDASNHIDLEVYNGGTLIQTITNIRHFSYSKEDSSLTYTYQYNYVNPSNLSSGTINSTITTCITKQVGSGSWKTNIVYDFQVWSISNRNGMYADLSQGYTLNLGGTKNMGIHPNIWYPKNFVENFIYTIDLDTITPSNDSLKLELWSADPDDPLQIANLDNHRVFLQKTGGVWQLMSQYTTGYGDPPPVAVADLPDHTGQNVYQIVVNRTGFELRYVGDWPSQVGEANYYRSWTQDFLTPIENPDCIKYVYMGFSTTTSLYNAVMRFDAATYRGYSYRITEDLQYDPANMIGSNNVVTKLQSITRAGSSITFGGNTYTVTNYNLMMGTHKIPLSGLRFESVLNENNTYDNKINGHVVSTTATPSTVTFDGKWLVNVASAEMTPYTYTGTQWKAGEFGWDGMDHNFLIVGLITCLGVFIGCGIYARKSRSGGILPLMIVTGCAAFVFFIML